MWLLPVGIFFGAGLGRIFRPREPLFGGRDVAATGRNVLVRSWPNFYAHGTAVWRA